MDIYEHHQNLTCICVSLCVADSNLDISFQRLIHRFPLVHPLPFFSAIQSGPHIQPYGLPNALLFRLLSVSAPPLLPYILRRCRTVWKRSARLIFFGADEQMLPTNFGVFFTSFVCFTIQGSCCCHFMRCSPHLVFFFPPTSE